jgi:3-hydroxyisobutyrate dehydrogenase-like beta-hydroxyacid dehydrogenase
MRLAFVGFGEAAQSIAAGLAEHSGASISAFDIRVSEPAAAKSLRQRANETGVNLCETMRQAVADAEIVISLVVGSAAVEAAEAAGAELRASQIYIDLNAISPQWKTRVAEALGGTGNTNFVEGAVMARVSPYRHKVPILLAGAAAERAEKMLNSLGMQCEAVGLEIGQASISKMVRSVFVKGIEALLIESLTAAERAGILERTLDSISQTFPGIDWRETASYYIARTWQHGERRVIEMNEAAETLSSLGLEPVLSLAIAATIDAPHAKLAAANLDANANYAQFVAVTARGDAPD